MSTTTSQRSSNTVWGCAARHRAWRRTAAAARRPSHPACGPAPARTCPGMTGSTRPAAARRPPGGVPHQNSASASGRRPARWAWPNSLGAAQSPAPARRPRRGEQILHRPPLAPGVRDLVALEDLLQQLVRTLPCCRWRTAIASGPGAQLLQLSIVSLQLGLARRPEPIAGGQVEQRSRRSPGPPSARRSSPRTRAGSRCGRRRRPPPARRTSCPDACPRTAPPARARRPPAGPAAVRPRGGRAGGAARARTGWAAGRAVPPVAGCGSKYVTNPGMRLR